MKVTSKLLTLAELLELDPPPRFSVPIYQRLYVWGEDQIRTLLEDINTAFCQRKPIFFLGGTLVVEREDRHGRHFELIDGQQRFTTLWMIAAAWRKAMEPFLEVTVDGLIQPRLQFVIRPEVNRFLLRQVEKATGRESHEAVLATSRMRDAMALIEAFLHDPEQQVTDVAALTEFIFTQVKLVLTIVPKHTDLNKLFEIINNRGVQLQNHEILKARMLDTLPEEERHGCATLWDACADMGNYVERNLRDLMKTEKLNIAELFDPKDAAKDEEKLANAGHVLEVIKSLEKDGMDATRQPLSDILEPAVPEETAHATGDPSGVDEEGDRVRSIVGFPVFLQHVLRIWLQEQNYPDIPRILDRELLTLFENHFFQASSDNAELRRANVRSFISLLWELRYLFDKHTIKWVDLGEEEMHLICSLRLTKSGNYLSLTRDQEESGDTRGFSLLQSMLYHSQQITTQYWLTPLLAFIKKHKGGVNRYYRYLRHLDNHLFSSNDEGLLIERTRGFLEEFWKARPLSAPPVLREPLGVKFPHYWFYKLEFILWFQGPERHGIEKRDQAQCWRSFHFTAKNSVEHISPQTPQEVDRTVLSRTTLDRFGNLALVSRSVNSEYSNLPFDEKRARFWNRNQSKLDSLKMALIYSEEDWGDQEASRHETRMLEAFEEYFATEHAQAQL